MVSRIFRVLFGVTILLLCACVWAAPRYGGGPGGGRAHMGRSFAARGSAGSPMGGGGARWYRMRGPTPGAARDDGRAYPRFAQPSRMPRDGSPPMPMGPRSPVTPVNGNGRRAPQVPNNPEQMRSGSIRAAIARYNEERPGGLGGQRPQPPARRPAEQGLRMFPGAPFSGN